MIRELEVVKVVSGDSYANINKADFIEGVHVIWEGVEEVAAAAAEKAEEVAETVVEKVEEKAGWGKAPPPSA